ncbi:MAG: M23 family metallopeptidase [FCB group bacterium]|nr:M23 family metallopeptidase [FCB group bacterium]
MKARKGKISILFVPEDEGESKSYRMSRGTLKFLKWIAALFILTLIAAGVSYYFLWQKALNYDRMAAENLRLLDENRRVYELADELESLQAMDRQIRRALGAALEIDTTVGEAVFDVSDHDLAGGGRFFEEYELVFQSPVDGLVSRGYTEKLFPLKSHAGVDLAVPEGTLISAAADGWTVFDGWHQRYGNYLIIQHPGDYLTFYGHLSSVLAVRGELVKAGEPVAVSGNSGRSSAPHLHFEITYRGKKIDPGAFIPEFRESGLPSENLNTTGGSETNG